MFPKGYSLVNVWAPSLTWSDLWKNWPIKQKPKILVLAVDGIFFLLCNYMYQAFFSDEQLKTLHWCRIITARNVWGRLFTMAKQ